jgi:hypothetical protein
MDKFETMIVDEFARYFEVASFGEVDINNACPLSMHEDKREMAFRSRVDQYVRDKYGFKVQACVGCCFMDEIRPLIEQYIKKFKHGGCPCRTIGEDESVALLEKFLKRMNRR